MYTQGPLHVQKILPWVIPSKVLVAQHGTGTKTDMKTSGTE
jgi:hypothetical protein